MSDFLDRLAARAIDGEAALAPRLPSLFEPLQRAPVMSPADEGGMPVHPHDVPAAAPAVPAAAPLPRSPEHAGEPMERGAVRAVPAKRAPVAAPAHAAVEAPREPLRSPSPVAPSPARASAAERPATPSTPERSTASLPPVSPRQARVAPARQEAAPVRAPVPGGALLPAPSPVFAAMPAAAAPSGRSAAARATAARAESRAAAAGEPVVHVSIGRLEVRAASAAVPPRRREEPRPTSLDDYLRQRGKATP